MTAKWWVLWAMATGFALTLALFGAALLAARRVVRLALPLPPASEGAPPRCRCCGASLPEAGLVRRCLYCGVDHVVMGARYQELEATLEASLASMERRMDVTLATRMRRANRALALAGTLPILVAVLAPAGLFLGGTRPLLWILTGILLAAGTALLAAGARMPVPRIRTLEEAEPGDAVFLDGSPLLVEAALDLNVNSPVEGSVLILSEGVPPKRRRALHVFRDGEDRFSSSLLEIREGGEPWPEGGNTAELYPVSASTGATGPLAGAGGLLSFARFTSQDRRNWALSLWKRGTNPPPGLSPDWTLCTVEPVAEERVVFASKGPFEGRE